MVDPMMPQVVIVTGASSGIGEATALALAEAGLERVRGGRRLDRMAGLAERGITVAELDVTDDGSMTAFVDRVLADRGRIDVLINNAGYGSYGSVEDVPMDEGRPQFEVNLFGLARMTQLATPAHAGGGFGADRQHRVHGRPLRRGAGRLVPRQQVRGRGIQRQPAARTARVRDRVILIEPGSIRTEWGGGANDSAEKYSGAGAYAGQVKAMKRLYSHRRPVGSGARAVIADAIRDAVQAKRPKTRYADAVLGQGDHRR